MRIRRAFDLATDDEGHVKLPPRGDPTWVDLEKDTDLAVHLVGTLARAGLDASALRPAGRWRRRLMRTVAADLDTPPIDSETFRRLPTFITPAAASSLGRAGVDLAELMGRVEALVLAEPDRRGWDLLYRVPRGHGRLHVEVEGPRGIRPGVLVETAAEHAGRRAALAWELGYEDIAQELVDIRDDLGD